MKIANFTLKGVKSFRGHEGETCYQGNIYMDNKKVGTFSDNSWSGEIDYDLDAQYEKKVKENLKEWFTKNPFGLEEKYNIHNSRYNLLELYGENRLMEAMLAELENLYYIEKELKSFNKKGYPLMALAKKSERHNVNIYGIVEDAIADLKKEYKIVHILSLEDLEVA